MFSLESNLIPESWEVAKPRLSKALGDYLPQAQIEVQAGREVIYRVNDTFMLLRGEILKDNTRELVVVALAGDMAAGTMSAVNHARIHGFDSIRAHFAKKGALRFIERKLKLPVREVETRENEHVLQIRFNDMGGKSSSKSTSQNVTTTTNNSGSAAAGGDNLGVMLSGVNNSDINLQMTDHGAMAVAGNLAEEAFNFGNNSLKVNQNVVSDSLDFASDALYGAFNFGEEAINANKDVSQYAIDSIASMAGQQSETTKAAIAMANASKAREQTGENNSNNELLKNISLMVGILGTVITIAYLLAGRKS